MKKETKELLDKVVNDLRSIKEIIGIVIYGSYSREEEDVNSDIDLLVILKTRTPKRFLDKVINIISGHDKVGRISPRLTNLEDYEPDFLENIMREGKILFGKFVLDNKKLLLKPYLLISYDLSDVDKVTKVRVSRRVHGYTSKKAVGKNEAAYTYKGLKDEPDVFVISNACILLPPDQKGFIGFLERENVKYKLKNVWLR